MTPNPTETDPTSTTAGQEALLLSPAPTQRAPGTAAGDAAGDVGRAAGDVGRAAGDVGGAPSEGYTHRAILVIMSGLMLGMFLAALDQTIVSTALPKISQDFHRTDLYSWVVTSYLLTSTVTTPLYGKISDMFGRKAIFQFAIVLFLAGSALSGLAGSMIQLIIFRGVQGLGGGGLFAVALSIVGDVIPPRDRGRYQGYFGAVFGVASVVGPLVGGFLVEQISWRWVFYVNLPIGLVALVVINRVLRSDRRRSTARVDIAGSLLSVGGVALFLVAVQSAGQDRRITATSAAFGVVGLLLVALFVWWETRASEPIVPLRLFRNGVFAVSSVLSLVTGAVMFGAIIFLPQYLQFVRGVSPTMAGLRLLALLVGILFSSIGSGQLISRRGTYKVYVVVGTALVAVGMYLMSLISVTTSSPVLYGMMLVVGLGLGLFMQTLVLATQNSIAIRDMGVGTSAITFFRTLGGAIGAAVLGAVMIDQRDSLLPADVAHYGKALGTAHAFTTAMDRAFLWSVPVAIIAFAISFLLKDLRLRTSAGSPPAQGAGTGAHDEAPAVELPFA
ncbi:MAG TPA: MDR family MFS transporter [Acidimicrobiales bacterium]|nr:MDR family MFS transporter [Acidimicrobiales bacterium]